MLPFEECKKILKERLNEHRYNHMLGVVESALQLAERFGVDEEKARYAALLHDCAREFSTDALVKEAEKQLDAIGAHTGSSDATAKGDSSVTGTGKVQTGDNNGPVFAGIAAAMAAAAAAIAGVFIRKRSPKN